MFLRTKERFNKSGSKCHVYYAQYMLALESRGIPVLLGGVPMVRKDASLCFNAIGSSKVSQYYVSIPSHVT